MKNYTFKKIIYKNIKFKIFYCYIFVILSIFLPISVYAWRGMLTYIHDGDTIVVSPIGSADISVKIRLYGIDAPEKGQPGGKEAARYLHSLVPILTSVEITEITNDKFGRKVALVECSDGTVNELMVEAGHAWVYARYCHAEVCKSWRHLQREAAAERRGLWREGRPIAPWLWRRGMRD